MNYILEFFSLILFLFLSATFSGLEAAYISTSLLNAKMFTKKNLSGSKELYKIKKNQKKVITILLIGNNIANIASAAIATRIAIEIFGDIGVGIATGILTIVILIFGEIIPKSIATLNSKKIALKTSVIIYKLCNILNPILLIFEKITELIVGKNQNKMYSFTESDFKNIVDLGVDEKFYGKEEKMFIKNILDFADCKVEDIMTEKKDIISISYHQSVNSALKFAKTYRFMRFPVENKKTKQMVGVVHLRDLIKYAKGNSKIKVYDIAREIRFVKKDYSISTLFQEFRKNKTHIAAVIDKNNIVVGLVTFEDMIEEIFGEIYDETEIPVKMEVRYAGTNASFIKGSAEIHIKIVNDILKTNIPEDEEFKTINGLLRVNLKDKIKKGSLLKIEDSIIKVIEKEEAGNIIVKIQKK